MILNDAFSKKLSPRAKHSHVRVVGNHLELLIQTLSTNDKTPPQALTLFVLAILDVSGVVTISSVPTTSQLLPDLHDLQC